jgi:hypothetical protein
VLRLGANGKSAASSHDECLGMNPNFSGSDYGFWHYRNVIVGRQG